MSQLNTFTASNNQKARDSRPAQPQNTQGGDPSINRHDIHNLIQQKQRLPFLGLEDHNDTEYPDSVSEAHPAWSSDPVTFSNIIKLLPEAEEGKLRAVNQYVNDDGTIDIQAIENINGFDLDALPIDPGEISQADQYFQIPEYKDIIDPRRQALAALGYNIKFRWQIATDTYTIINPKDAYWPAYRTFKENGEAENIFGWADLRDYGGKVDIYLFFADHTIKRPDNSGDPIYIGYQTGYDFRGGRKMDLKLFGYDPERDTRFYSLGPQRGRRHVGNPTNADHERKNGRVPIKEWWGREYANLQIWTDDLINDIETATKITIDFSNFEFTPQEFFQYLDIPESYIKKTDKGPGVIKRAKRHSPNPHKFTMWTLFLALSTTLEEEFHGDDHTSTQFKVYADIATNILRSPHRTIEQTKQEHDHQKQKENNRTATQNGDFIDTNIPDIASITNITGVSTEDDLNLLEKRDITNNIQKNLFDFNSNTDNNPK